MKTLFYHILAKLAIGISGESYNILCPLQFPWKQTIIIELYSLNWTRKPFFPSESIFIIQCRLSLFDWLIELRFYSAVNLLRFFFFFFDLGFTALSRIFHLYRANRSSKVGENQRNRRKTTWPSISRTWLSHIWPERGSNHSGEKPNGLRVNSLIH